MQECTDLSMITQHINNTFILIIKMHIYTKKFNITQCKTQTHSYFLNLLAVIAVTNFIKKQTSKLINK